MSEDNVIHLIEDDGCQVLRLPPDMRMRGTTVRVSRRIGGGLLLEPTAKPIHGDMNVIFNEMDRTVGGPFPADGRHRPTMSPDGDGAIGPPPTIEEMRANLARLDEYRLIPFMENGREQPPMPDDDDLASFDP